ncbi:MAG: hypothetical protein WCG93_07960 [Paludibacter sp.]
MKKSDELISTAVNWYIETRPIYEELSHEVENIIHENSYENNPPIHAIFNRTKDIESFAKKIANEKYTDPSSQITDLSAIRIIACVENDLSKISKLIESIFEIDYDNSIDKSKSLGTDKVGYRSIHYVARLPSRLTKLPEYRKFKNLRFEIQIRTLLQHAWAEIEHDRNYKFSGKLPEDLTRRLKVLAGVLELADREFNQIANEVEKYELTSKTVEENLKIQNNSSTYKFNSN